MKSTLCMAILYGFYHFFLRDEKTFVFNRFFLLLSVVFALVIPLISIESRLPLPITPAIEDMGTLTIKVVEGEVVHSENSHWFSWAHLLFILYLLISALMLMRFLSNIANFIKTFRKGRIKEGEGLSIVMVDRDIMPYSFIGTIYVNRKEYERGLIPQELMLHEKVHCSQYHSLDILFIELVKIVFWLNPFVWLFARAMKLNHEFLADNSVLADHNVDQYRHLLFCLVFNHKTSGLASGFQNSFTKKRLIMMTKQNPSKKANIRKIAAVPVFLALAISLTFSQQQNDSEQNSQSRENTSSRQETQVGKAAVPLTDFNGSEWWLPILEEENVEVLAFNNFEKVFEMGTSNEITNGMVRLENAYIIIRMDNEGGYLILTSPVAVHWLKDDLIWASEATIKFRTADNQSLLRASNVRLQWNENADVDMESEKLIINMQSDWIPPPPPPPTGEN